MESWRTILPESSRPNHKHSKLKAPWEALDSLRNESFCAPAKPPPHRSPPWILTDQEKDSQAAKTHPSGDGSHRPSTGWVVLWLHLAMVQNDHNAIPRGKKNPVTRDFPLTDAPNRWRSLLWRLLIVKGMQDKYPKENALTIPSPFVVSFREGIRTGKFEYEELCRQLESYVVGIK